MSFYVVFILLSTVGCFLDINNLVLWFLYCFLFNTCFRWWGI